MLPEVREAEPSIPSALPEIEAQGEKCQKLGAAGWNNIKYKDIQKKLHAYPVFDSLKVNDQLKNLGKNSYTETILTRTDLTLGSITHGLLQQRSFLADEVRKLTVKFPEAGKYLKETLTNSTSAFKNMSDDLLHYTCARRSEVIDNRRKLFRPRSEYLSGLSKIPPSKSHIFAEEQLSEFLLQNGGSFRVFPSKFSKIPSKDEKPRVRPGVKSSKPQSSRTRSPFRGTRNSNPKSSKGKKSHSSDYRFPKKSDRWKC